ncbi:alcohol dehydrogenase catalytic domain-containing protein [Saccharomonospora sp. NPDC046836]|uniref:alcohol dehydrogenase catalytic domain-containing protein n=1 Tax=Saccharomonospora sp. NPDC046836 TaxID=3156921 RepID=UPI0033E7E7DB
MSRARAAVLRRTTGGPFATERPLSIETLELDAPGAGEVEVRMEAAGICHSDLSRVNGTRAAVLPMVLGHEGSGTVVRCGPDTHGIRVGDRVVTTFLPRCGTCLQCTGPGWSVCGNGTRANKRGELLRGGLRFRRDDATPVHHNAGVSAFATRTVVDASALVVVPRSVPADVAAVLGCAVLTGGGAVSNAGRLLPGQTVAIVGLGGVGFAAMLVAAGRSPAAILAVDMLQDKLAMAPGFGATAVATPDEATMAGTRYDLVVECVGNRAALETAIALTGPGGRTVTVGLPAAGANLSVSPLSLVTEGRSLIGSYVGSGVPRADIQAYARMFQAGDLPLDRLISGHIGLDQINEGMDALHRGDVLRQIITLDQEPDATA